MRCVSSMPTASMYRGARGRTEVSLEEGLSNDGQHGDEGPIPGEANALSRGTRGEGCLKPLAEILGSAPSLCRSSSAPASQQGRGLEGAAVAMPMPQVSTFQCPICMEGQAVDEAVMFAACGKQEHSACRQCTFTYVKGKVNEAYVEGIPCAVGAASGGCEVATETEVLSILKEDAEAIRKYHFFKEMLNNTGLRECPKVGCGQLCEPILVDGKPLAKVTCMACQSEFCYFHSWAHQGMDCAGYAAKLLKEERKMAKKMGLKYCPGCQRQTKKDGGCNHMTCVACQCRWCWKCGEKRSSCVCEQSITTQARQQRLRERWPCPVRFADMSGVVITIFWIAVLALPFLAMGLCMVVLYVTVMATFLPIRGLLLAVKARFCPTACEKCCLGRPQLCHNVCCSRDFFSMKRLIDGARVTALCVLFLAALVLTLLVIMTVYPVWAPVILIISLTVRGSCAIRYSVMKDLLEAPPEGILGFFFRDMFDT